MELQLSLPTGNKGVMTFLHPFSYRGMVTVQFAYMLSRKKQYEESQCLDIALLILPPVQYWAFLMFESITACHQYTLM